MKYIHYSQTKRAYLLSVIDAADFLSSSPAAPQAVENMLNMLKRIGFLSMMGETPDDDLIQKVKQIITAFDFSLIDTASPASFDFEAQTCKLEFFVDTNLPEPPSWGAEPVIEQNWEQAWHALIDEGKDLILFGLDIEAVRLGAAIITGRPDGFQNTAFTVKAHEYSTKLSENISGFYQLTDFCFNLLKTYFYIPESGFKSFLRTISQKHDHYAANNYFRFTIPAEETDAIFEQVKSAYNENLNVILTYCYKAALALETIKTFIIHRCLNRLSQTNTEITNLRTPDKWQLASSMEKETIDTETPILFAGDKQYNIYIINPGVKAWCIRKDKGVSNALPDNNPAMDGALFFSYREYYSGAVLVRFDAYRNREEFQKVLNRNNESFVRLPVQEIAQTEDRREAFLENAADQILDAIPELLKRIIEAMVQKEQMIRSNAEKIYAFALLIGIAKAHFQKAALGRAMGDSFEQAMSEDLPSSEPTTHSETVILIAAPFDTQPDYAIDEQFETHDNMRRLRVRHIRDDFAYAAFATDHDGRLIHRQSDQLDDEDPEYQYQPPEGTVVVIVAIGSKDDIDGLLKAVGPGDTPAVYKPQKGNIYWVIYAPMQTEKKGGAHD